MTSKRPFLKFLLISLLLHFALFILLPQKEILQKNKLENYIKISMVTKAEKNEETVKKETIQEPEITKKEEPPLIGGVSVNNEKELAQTKTKEIINNNENDNKNRPLKNEVQANVNPFQGLMEKINKAKEDNYPLAARKMGYKGSVLIELRLDKEGNLLGCNIYKPSKYKILNKAAEQLIYKVMKEPYKHNTGNEVLLRIPVKYIIK